MRSYLLLNFRLYSLVLVALTLTSFACYSPVVAASNDVANKVGKSIYLSGTGKNGEIVTAVSAADTKVTGEKASCANCHRRSGFGSSEGGLLIPSITGNSLFSSREFKYRELKKSNRPITRTAYNKASLKKAIQSGIDSNGRQLNSLMPRYDMNASDMDDLISYLSTLGVKPAAGVDDKIIHFATIITPDVSEKRKAAMLAVLHTYTEAKNAGTRVEEHRASNSPWHKQWSYTAYREWKLHVWELNGEAESWSKQLNNFYKEQPVFSIVSGISNSNWQPMHDFCNNHEIPCLFPNTMLPGKLQNKNESGQNAYSIYFSQGINLEAKVIAKHISREKNTERCDNIVQIIDDTEKAKIAADTLIAQLESYKVNSKTSIIINKSNQFEKYIDNNSAKPSSTTCLVNWTDNAILMEPDNLQNVERIYIAHQVKKLSEIISLKPNIPVYYSTPYSLEKKRKLHLRRIFGWLKINKISPVVEDVTSNTYYAVTLLAKGIKHIRSHFSRDYMIERVEHMVDTMPFHSIYKTLSLGPEQRFASKGAYIIGPIKEATNANNPDNAEWIIP